MRETSDSPRLSEVTRQRDDLRSRLEAVSDILGALSRSAMRLQPILDQIVEAAARLGRADSCLVWLVDGEFLRPECDLRGFTAFVETAEPEELIDVIGDYHATAGELVMAHGGTVEHFAGDGLMVFFNDPMPLADHELQAARLAIAMRERLGELAVGWRKRGYELGLGAGIAVGHATLGRIGFEGRYDYGALGSVTNLAARLSDAATAGQILLTQRAHATLEGRVDAAFVAELEVKGLARPVQAFELLRVH